MIVNVVCRGVTPLLINKMNESVLESLRTKIKKPKAANIGTTRTPREEASEKVYLHTGKCCMPGEMLMACLINAGAFIRLDGKRMMSTAKSTLLPGFMGLMTPVIMLVDPDDLKREASWEPDVRKGTNPNGNEAVCICRPRWDRWAFEAQIDIDTLEIGENAIRELWDKAGRRMGLGDFRPQRKGIFGRFVVEKWNREEEVGKAAE
jgi:hypothetical protein